MLPDSNPARAASAGGAGADRDRLPPTDPLRVGVAGGPADRPRFSAALITGTRLRRRRSLVALPCLFVSLFLFVGADLMVIVEHNHHIDCVESLWAGYATGSGFQDVSAGSKTVPVADWCAQSARICAGD